MDQVETSQAVRLAREPLRREAFARQRAAWGLLTVAVATNTALWDLLCRSQRNWSAEAAQLRSQLRHAETVRDQAVRELGSLSLEVAREREAREVQAAAYAQLEGYRYISECTVTAYCCEPYEHICGTGDGLTATGIPATPGVVAVDPDLIPLGSTVIIDGQCYLAADTGGAVKGRHVDIAVPTHAEAEDFGVQTAEVWVVANG